MSKSVLITGITGFVGKNLLKHLDNNLEYKIYGVTRDKRKIIELSEILDGYYTYDELFKKEIKFNYYIHLAGQVIDNEKMDESVYHDSNFLLTKKVYDKYLSDPDAEKFIFLSSIHVLTDIPKTIINESFEPHPFTAYGRTKYLAEKYIEENVMEEKKHFIFRPTMIHGPGNKGNLKQLYTYLVRGWPYPFGSISNSRSFLSIDNFTFIISEILKNDIDSGLYHLADDEPTKTHDIINIVSKLSGKKIRKLNIPIAIFKAISLMGNIAPFGLDSAKLSKLMNDFIVDNSKIKKALGKPLPVSSCDGLKKTIESFQMNDKL